MMATVTHTTSVGQARAAVVALARRTGDLLRSLPATDVPIPGSEWTVRDAAVHLVHGAGQYSEIAHGVPSPCDVPAGDGAAFRDIVALDNRQGLADIPETDPLKLAKLVLDSARRLIDTTAGRPDDQLVPYHCGIALRVADLVWMTVSEYILHGYDMAVAVGFPWPIDPAHAAFALAAGAPLDRFCVNGATTKGLDAAYELELRGFGRSVVRFVNGEYQLDPDDSGPVDCTISADPVAYLLVGAGRLSPWTAVALGLMSAGGKRPELAWRLNDLFIYP